MSDNDAEELLPVTAFEKVIKTTIRQAACPATRQDMGRLTRGTGWTCNGTGVRFQPVSRDARGRYTQVPGPRKPAKPARDPSAALL